MINISQNSILKYILFFNLYASEGLIFSLSTVVLVLYFNQLNIPIHYITLVAGIVNAPWILKFLPGPIVDHFINYGRKPFILIGGLTGALCMFPLAIIDPTTAIIPFTAFFFLGHLGIVFLDVSADAWAIQITEYEERGKVNASMAAGLFTFLAGGGIFLAYIGQTYSYPLTFITVGCLILITLILPFIVKEVTTPTKRKKTPKLLLQEFKKPNTQLFTLLEFLSAFTFGFLLYIIPDYMKNVLFLDDVHTGIISALFPLFIVIGAAIGGVIVDIYRRKPLMIISFIGTLIFSASLIFASTWQTLAIIYAAIGFLQGTAVYSALAAMAFDITNPKIGATQYSVLASVHNFGDIGSGMISGFLVVTLGYNRFFLYVALFMVPVLALLYFIKEKEAPPELQPS